MRVEIEHGNDTMEETVGGGFFRKSHTRKRTRFWVSYSVRITNVERYILDTCNLWDVVLCKHCATYFHDVRYGEDVSRQDVIDANTQEYTVRLIVDHQLLSIQSFDNAMEAKLWEQKLRDEIFAPLKNLITNNRPRKRSEIFKL